MTTKIILVGVAIVCGGFVVGVLLRGDELLWAPLEVVFLVVLPCVLAIVAAFAARAKASTRSGALVALVTTVLSVLIGEIVVALWDARFGGAGGVDSRGRLERVLDARGQGRHAVPAVHPINLFAEPLAIDGSSVLPLGGIGNAYTIFCNEIGKWYEYESDSFGFVNPVAAWESRPLEIAILGDSFAQGACIPEQKSFAELIRAQFPSTLNLGNQGDGPLLALATLREYLTATQPKKVLWFFFEGNDIDDLSKELQQPILAKYLLDPSFSQQLMQRAEVVNEALSKEVERRLAIEMNIGPREKMLRASQKFSELIRPALKLWHIRDRLGLVNFRNKWSDANFNPSVSKEEVAHALEQIFLEAKGRVAAWGGELIVVYLPAQENFMRAGRLVAPYPWRAVVLETLTRLRIPLVDVYPLLTAEPDPLKFFPFARGGWGHYSEYGNAIVADAVLKRLRGIEPKDSLESRGAGQS